MNKAAVIDLGYGDAGKGSFVAYICDRLPNPLVVRFSGGQQAGHTVVHNGVRHVFSSFGSGTLQGCPTYWNENSDNITIYPPGFLNELEVLQGKGVAPKVFVHGKTPVTTPYDIQANKRYNDKSQHGSCGLGFGKTLEREEKYYSLLVEDLHFPSVFVTKLEMIASYYGGDGDHYDFVRDCMKFTNHIEIVYDINELYGECDYIIYEGSQGLMLDKDIGYFPHVTRANVGSKVINDEIDDVYYITRAYQTRHGNGPLSNSGFGHNIKENSNETNVTNYQGEFRRSLLDLDVLKYAIAKDKTHAKRKHLVITCLDHVEDSWLFTHNGCINGFTNEDEFVKGICDILGFKEVYVSHSDEYKYIKRIVV